MTSGSAVPHRRAHTRCLVYHQIYRQPGPDLFMPARPTRPRVPPLRPPRHGQELNEEIKFERLVRDAGSFARFLEIECLSAPQRANLANLPRAAGVARETVRSYFAVVEETLLGMAPR